MCRLVGGLLRAGGRILGGWLARRNFHADFSPADCQNRAAVLMAGRMVWVFRQLEFRFGREARGSVREAVEGAVLREDPGLAAWCADAAEGLGLAGLARRVKVSWNPRMRTTAGRAWWPDRVIELNPKLKQLEPEQMWRTLKHELAHLVAYERAGRRRIQVHGPEWELACRELGIGGEKPFHELPFRRRRMRKRFAYICPQCWSTIERVKKISHAVACYDCCRKFSRGQFDPKYRLVEKRLG